MRSFFSDEAIGLSSIGAEFSGVGIKALSFQRCFSAFARLMMGIFLDQLAILSLAMPLAFPTALALDYDPVSFGIVVTNTVEIGLLTPPLGLKVYVAAAQTGVPLCKIFRGILPFLAMEMLILLLLLCFPQITLWLPSLMLR
ncbi:TRAP transporter large permease subunit [Thalassovita aquimarina]|uniref:TRAP transporter large permease subunit n=1 Tax=Thalassovita aquimarina TaxID=2785917 RepID=UPI00356929E5